MNLIECPRDAMQGMHTFVPTEFKIKYLQKLLAVGFQVLDFGSFVSPKAVPQMQDTAEVLSALDLHSTPTKLLAIVANMRGAEDALSHEEIEYIGFPFSVSETFQQKNTRKSMAQAYELLKELQNYSKSKGKKLNVYISMGFGNLYGDPYSPEIVLQAVENLAKMDIEYISVADTLGMAQPEDISQTFEQIYKEFPHIEAGAHFHSTPDAQSLKLGPAYDAGCRRFDSAMGGLGGCPLSGNDLVGNIDTQYLIDFLCSKGEKIDLNEQALAEAQILSNELIQYK